MSVLTQNKTLKPSEAEVQFWLEWAGARLLSLNIRSPKPKSPGCAWPEFARNAIEAYGYSNARLRPAAPDRFEIVWMDEILTWVNLIDDPLVRRIVSSRMMVAPISDRYLFNWTRIAQLVHLDRRRVRVLHGLGLKMVAERLDPSKIDVFRRLIPPPMAAA